MAWATEAESEQAAALVRDVARCGAERELLALLDHIRGGGVWDTDRVRGLLACARGAAQYAVDPTDTATPKGDSEGPHQGHKKEQK